MVCAEDDEIDVYDDTQKKKNLWLSSFEWVLFTGEHSNQDLMWCVKIGVYMGLCVHGGS